MKRPGTCSTCTVLQHEAPPLPVRDIESTCKEFLNNYQLIKVLSRKCVWGVMRRRKHAELYFGMIPEILTSESRHAESTSPMLFNFAVGALDSSQHHNTRTFDRAGKILVVAPTS